MSGCIEKPWLTDRMEGLGVQEPTSQAFLIPFLSLAGDDPRDRRVLCPALFLVMSTSIWIMSVDILYIHQTRTFLQRGRWTLL